MELESTWDVMMNSVKSLFSTAYWFLVMIRVRMIPLFEYFLALPLFFNRCKYNIMTFMYMDMVQCCTCKCVLYTHTVGHGKSEGDRAHVNCFRTYYDDVIHHVEETKADYPDVPCFLMGHSNVSKIYSVLATCTCIILVQLYMYMYLIHFK